MNNIFYFSYPEIDLHGLDRDSARMEVNDFIRDNIALGNEDVIIIHGKGQGILKREVHETLRVNKNVLEYKTDNFNDGITLVKLKISLK